MHQRTRLLIDRMKLAGIEPADFAVLDTVRSCPLTTKAGGGHAAWLFEGWLRLGMSVRESDCGDSLGKLLDSKLIQVLDAVEIQKIDVILQQNPALGPMRGLRNDGILDLTLDGAKLLCQITADQMFPGEFYSVITQGWDGNQPCTKIIATSEQLAKHLLQIDISKTYSTRSPEGRLVIVTRCLLNSTPPESIGLWRDYWWREPSNGVKIEATYENVYEEIEVP